MAASSPRDRSSARAFLGPSLSAVRSGLREAVSIERLMLAAKTALAAGLAWFAAQLMPEPISQYPYYAPLGALVSMYPTVADSLRKGLQSLLGLALGIGVAMVVASFTETSALAIAVVIGFGVLVGGLPRMGTARDWVPLAALFVLVAGGGRREDFSLAYLGQMGVGVAIGFAVNWLVFPPLRYSAITPAFRRLRHTLGDQLDEMALALNESSPQNHQDWASREELLAETASRVRRVVEAAEESARVNPRRWRRRRDLAADLADLRAVERSTFQVQDITDLLSGVIGGEDESSAIPVDVMPRLGDALSATADVLRAWGESDSLPDVLARAEGTIDAVSRTYYEAATAHGASVSVAAAVSLSLARIIRVVRSREEGEHPDTRRVG
ncbi:FUSC family protein [Sinomonas sp. ASV486]|uniref:FUSC family protein n=1 Tax=Sinomonas sp. ASV486 TaxID=3051170 RepID=UPI0027DE4DA2|nr:FUSC family protein [Sinomonas sp. ASV486]MDQ4491520.1 FUSC family protein [Sinomonas sp. ASV486]